MDFDIWIGAADITPGSQVIYYYEVALDAPVPTPEGGELSSLVLPDPRNMQWVDRGALERLSAAGLAFGAPDDAAFFDVTDPSNGQAFASVAARELFGGGDLGLASTFAAPAPVSGELWHLSFTEDLYFDFTDGDYELVVEVYDGDDLVDVTGPVAIAARYEPDATMNLSTAAMTLLDNELFAVGVALTVGGSMVGSDGVALNAEHSATVTIVGDGGREIVVEPDEGGLFEVTLAEGSYLAIGSADGYDEDSVEFELVAGEAPPSLDFVLAGDFGFEAASHEFAEGETELSGTAGEVLGGVEPYTFSVAGGNAAFWLSVDPDTGDLVFADGVSEVPGVGAYDLDVDVVDGAGMTASGSVDVAVFEAPHSTLEVSFASHGLTEGSPTPTGHVGDVSGGVEPYAYTVTGGSAASWLDVDWETGDLVFADGASYVPGPGLYELDVEVTDSGLLPGAQPGVVAGVVEVEVVAVNIYSMQLSTGRSKVYRSDLEAGEVVLILNLDGDADALAEVALHSATHSIFLTPEPSGAAAFAYLSAADVEDSSTFEPLYGRYAVAFTPNGGDERTTSQFLNIVQTPEQGWQGEIWMDSGEDSLGHIEIGAAVNTSTSYDPLEDVVDPPLPDPGVEASISLWRDGIALHRDILAAEADVPLVWYFDVYLPDGDASLGWWFDDADSYYDVAIIENVDTGESFDLNADEPVTVPTGSHSFTLTLERSPYQTAALELAPQWTLISLPGPSVEGTPDALAELFEVDAIYGWDPAVGYDGPVVGSDPLDHISRGYFVHRDDTLDHVSEEISVDLDDPTAVEADIPVDTGWNIVGVVDGGIDAASISPTANTVFTWDAYAQAYVGPLASGDLLLPLQGAWVFNPGDPYTASVTQLRYRSSPSVTPVTTPLTRPDWLVSLRLESSDGQTRVVELGSADSADAGYDGLDIVTPPPPANRMYAEFYAEVDHIAGRLARSIQPLDRDGGEWTLAARVPVDGVVHWEGVSLPTGYRLTLEAGGERHDMLRRGQAALRGGAHSLRVRLSWAPPQQTRLLTNYPNPFNPETWIPFELSVASTVTVRVYDVGGQVVRRLDVGFRDAGYYTARSDAVYWDGSNNAGERVASGIYFYELRAGAQHSLRRMVIHK